MHSALTDALGSVRLNLDKTGSHLGTTDWDAWGHAGTSTGRDGCWP